MSKFHISAHFSRSFSVLKDGQCSVLKYDQACGNMTFHVILIGVYMLIKLVFICPSMCLKWQ